MFTGFRQKAVNSQHFPKIRQKNHKPTNLLIQPRRGQTQELCNTRKTIASLRPQVVQKFWVLLVTQPTCSDPVECSSNPPAAMRQGDQGPVVAGFVRCSEISGGAVGSATGDNSSKFRQFFEICSHRQFFARASRCCTLHLTERGLQSIQLLHRQREADLSSSGSSESDWIESGQLWSEAFGGPTSPLCRKISLVSSYELDAGHPPSAGVDAPGTKSEAARLLGRSMRYSQ